MNNIQQPSNTGCNVSLTIKPWVNVIDDYSTGKSVHCIMGETVAELSISHPKAEFPTINVDGLCLNGQWFSKCSIGAANKFQKILNS